MTKANLDDVRRLQQSEEFMRYMGGVRTEAEVLAYLDRNVAHWDEHGFGMWILRDRLTGSLAGTGGLRHAEFDGTHEVGIGYGLVPELWGHGLATEIARTCVTKAADQLSLASVVACASPDNAASIRVMAKAGFTFERDVTTPDGPGVLYRCRLTPHPPNNTRR